MKHECGLRSHAAVVTVVAEVPAHGIPALGTTEELASGRADSPFLQRRQMYKLEVENWRPQPGMWLMDMFCSILNHLFFLIEI